MTLEDFRSVLHFLRAHGLTPREATHLCCAEELIELAREYDAELETAALIETDTVEGDPQTAEQLRKVEEARRKKDEDTILYWSAR